MRKIFTFLLIINSAVGFSQYIPKIEKQKTIGGSLVDEISDIIQSDNDIIVAGSSNSSMSSEKAEDSRGNYDYWLMKLDTSFNIIWQKTIGGAAEDRLSSFYYIKEYRQIVCGGYSYSDSSSEKKQNSKGVSDYWIVKTNENGEIVWQKTIGGSGYDYLKSVIPAKDKGMLLAGSSNSNISGDKTENNFNQPGFFYNDYWVIRMDSLGNILWQKTIGGLGNDEISTAIATRDGGFIIGGTSSSSISGNKTTNSYGSSDYWIICLDSLGNIVWQKNYGGSGDESMRSILYNDSNGYYLIGTSTSGISGNKSVASKGSTDIWVIKIDSSGNILWQKDIGGNSLDYIYTAKLVSNGIVVGAGTLTGINGDKTESNKGSFDGWVFKLNHFGDIQWQKSIGGTNDERIYSMLPVSNGGLILGCFSNSDSSVDKIENSRGDYDYWMIKLNGNANQVYGRVYQDVNNNNTPDLGDIFYDNIKVQLLSNGNSLSHLSSNAGKYFFSIDTGVYSIQCISSFNYFSTTPGSITITKNNLGNTDTINFKVTPTAIVNDASISLINTRITRPNKQINYIINFSNESGQNYSGIIKLKLDNQLIYQNTDTTPSIIAGDTLMWTVTNMLPFSSKQININIQPVNSSQIGNTLNSFVKIYNAQTDVTPNNNQYTLKDMVRASLDPNNKEVDKTILSPAEVEQNPYLYYTIHFQNIGNDTAFDIAIKDTLDTNLDWSTFQPITASHKYSLEQTNNKYVLFDFKNIQLPDSTVNEKASHGFVFYKIKPKNTLVVGNSILNKASIVFDVNTPIVTNNAKTVVIQAHAGRDTIICSGQSIALAASGATSYIWNTGANTASITVSPATTASYVVTGTVNGISQNDTVVVSVKPLPLINIGNDRSICIGDSVTLTATTNGTSLLWNTGLSSNSIIVKPITTTNYSATATLNSCTNFDGISVAVKPLPNINFTKLLNGSEVQLIAPNGNTTYNWNFGDGSSTSTTQNPTHTYATNGKKYITLVSTLNGCTAQKTDSVTIAITAIKNNISFVDKIEVFPNPTDDFVTVQLKSKKAADFRALLITIDGKIIVSREYVNTTIINDEISLKNYSSGVYFLQIESENEQATYQLIKN